jgi:hypothetical protein
MAIVTLAQSAEAKDKTAANAGRRPASLSALAAPGVTGARPDGGSATKQGYHLIGQSPLPSGGETEALLSGGSPGSGAKSSQLKAPRVTLPRDRSMPRQGTLSPQYNYTDVNIQFR